MAPGLADYAEEFRARLRKYMAEKGLNQRQVASLIGYTPQQVSDYLTAREPSLPFVEAVSGRLQGLEDELPRYLRARYGVDVPEIAEEMRRRRAAHLVAEAQRLRDEQARVLEELRRLTGEGP